MSAGSEDKWTYNNYRASLRRNGQPFAIVSPDGSSALNDADQKILLDALNTQAAVAGMRAERDAALKANGELAKMLDIGPVSEAARQALQTRLTSSESEVAGLRARLKQVKDSAKAKFERIEAHCKNGDYYRIATEAHTGRELIDHESMVAEQAALRPAHAQTKST